MNWWSGSGLTEMDSPRLALPGNLERSLRHLDDAQLEELLCTARAEVRHPPRFSGRLDQDCIVEDMKVGRTAQTELLFLQYMLNHLRDRGRCAVVVPEGVLFGSTGAHRELHCKLAENSTVEEVLSPPGSVSNPYSGVKTSVLVFRKAARPGASRCCMRRTTASSWPPTRISRSTRISVSLLVLLGAQHRPDWIE